MLTVTHLAWSSSTRNKFHLKKLRIITKISTFHSFLLEQDNSARRQYAIGCWKFLWTETFSQWKWRMQKRTNTIINTEWFLPSLAWPLIHRKDFLPPFPDCGIEHTATKQSWQPLVFLAWKYRCYRTDSQLKAIRKLKPNHLLQSDGASCLVHYPPLPNLWGLATQRARICSFPQGWGTHGPAQFEMAEFRFRTCAGDAVTLLLATSWAPLL